MNVLQQLYIFTNDIDTDVEQLMEAGYTTWKRERSETIVHIDGEDLAEDYPIVMRTATSPELIDGMDYIIIQHELEGNPTAWLAPTMFGFRCDTLEEVEDILDQFGGDTPTQMIRTETTTSEYIDDETEQMVYNVYDCERLPLLLIISRKMERPEEVG